MTRNRDISHSKSLDDKRPSALISRMKRYDGEVDICIIGAGAAGGVLAKELSEGGHSVVVIEAGPWLDTFDDMVNDELEMLLGKLDWTGLRITAGQNPIETGRTNTGWGVGGTTVHYTAATLRLHASDFRVKTIDGTADDWPIQYSDLDRYYSKVEHELGVSGPLHFPWGEFHGPFPTGPLPMNARDEVVSLGMNKLGLTPSSCPHAVITAPWDGRSPCMYYGFCIHGCKSMAKSSTLVTYIPKAVNNGAEIRHECMAFNINHDSHGKARSVSYFDSNGNEQEQRAKVIIVSGYTIESPRLLLNSASGMYPDGLSNSSGMVGKNFMVHLGDNVYGRFENPLDSFITPPVGVINQDRYDTDPTKDFIRGYSLEAYMLFPLEFTQTLIADNLHLWGKRLHDILDEYTRFAMIGLVGEVLPSKENRITLAEEKDEFGIPVAKVYYTKDDNSKHMSKDGTELCVDIMKAGGAIETFTTNGTIHVLGTCRMGNDPSTSVVDQWCRSHDISNLFICDGSVFVTGGAVNPSLTIQAIATRTADYIKHKIRNGEL
ncbi:MAG: GMC family oxidoreductase [Armatimonadota bacterium]